MVWLIVIGAHGYVFFVSGRIAVVVDRDEEDEMVTMAITPPPEPREPPPEDSSKAPARAARAGITRAGRSSAREAATPAATAAQSSSIAAPPLDWNAAAKRAARNALTGESATPHEFGVAPASPYRDCVRKKSSFEWNPDAKRFGMSGGLPYMHLGKRCVVGLPFFACAIGELPPPDSHLLDDAVKDNALQGSVPDAEDCVPPATP